MSGLQPRSVTFSVEGWQWDELYENTEDRSSRHPIQVGVNIKVQLHIWPKLILRAWNNVNPESLKELAYLGFASVPSDRCVKQLRQDSSLCLISGISQKIRRVTWRADSHRQAVNTLLDCGIPIVLTEDVETRKPSGFVNKEGDHVIAISFLFGDLTHSTSLFDSPVVSRVQSIGERLNLAEAILLTAEPQPANTKSEIEHKLYYDRIHTFERQSQ